MPEEDGLMNLLSQLLRELRSLDEDAGDAAQTELIERDVERVARERLAAQKAAQASPQISEDSLAPSLATLEEKLEGLDAALNHCSSLQNVADLLRPCENDKEG